jgi:hypothetical protein
LSHGQSISQERRQHNIVVVQLAPIFLTMGVPMPYADVNDIHMYYEDIGSGAPMLFIHGAVGCIDQSNGGLSGLMEFVQSSYRIISIEYRGR